MILVAQLWLVAYAMQHIDLGPRLECRDRYAEHVDESRDEIEVVVENVDESRDEIEIEVNDDIIEDHWSFF